MFNKMFESVLYFCVLCVFAGLCARRTHLYVVSYFSSKNIIHLGIMCIRANTLYVNTLNVYVYVYNTTVFSCTFS